VQNQRRNNEDRSELLKITSIAVMLVSLTDCGDGDPTPGSEWGQYPETMATGTDNPANFHLILRSFLIFKSQTRQYKINHWSVPSLELNAKLAT
jgi:hypothetical protein